MYSWRVCPSIGDGNDYTIRLNSWPECGPAAEATSDPFEITGSLPSPTLTLTSPNGGEMWEAGTVQAITWDSTNATGNVYAYLASGGSYWDWAGSAPMADGEVSREICQYSGDGSNYTIQIQWCDCGPCVTDESDAPFEISGSTPAPTITVTSPCAGDTWQAGTTHTIAWTSDTSEGYVQMYAVTGLGDWFWIDSVSVSDGSVCWDICPSIGDATDYTIHLDWWGSCGPTVEAISDPFEITSSLPSPTVTLTSPNGGEMWEAGTAQLITWNSTNATGGVHAYLKKGRYYWDSIGSAPMTDGQLNGEICSYVGDGVNYTVWIESCDCGPCVDDESDESFEIAGSISAPTITVTSPCAGDIWQAGTTQTIAWTSDTSEGYVEMYGVTGAGEWFWIDYVPVSDGSFEWDICPSIGDGTDYTIRLRWWGGCGRSVQAISDLFEITGSLPSLTLTLSSPNGNELWEAGTAHLITWNNTNATGDVDAYFRKGGDSWEWIGTGPMANGQLSWEICPYIGDGSDYTIWIQSCDCGPCVTDESDARFEIAGSLPWPTLLGDLDANHVLDLADSSRLAECLGGPGNSRTGCCSLFDFDCDGDIDLGDVHRFQSGFSSAGIPADPACSD